MDWNEVLIQHMYCFTDHVERSSKKCFYVQSAQNSAEGRLMFCAVDYRVAVMTRARCWHQNLNTRTYTQVLSSSTVQVMDTLTDTFGREHSYLRISLTERCNLKCELKLQKGHY